MAKKKLNDNVTQSKKNGAETVEIAPKEWTIMIYMAGDNNLSEDMITSLKDLKRFAGHSQVNIIVFYDTSYPPQRISIYDFSKNPPKGDLGAFQIENAVYHILDKPVPTNATSDSFDPKIEFVPLIKFVPWVLSKPKYKAKKYALILSGHSDGILGKTILRDDNPPTSVTLKTLGGVLETCRKSLEDYYPNNKKFDLLGFDSCLMGMVESAYEIKDSAKFMVSSEGNIPNAGWNYADVLKQLLDDNGKTEAKDLAISIVRDYACYNYDFIPSGRSINISAYNLEKIEPFAKRLDLFAGILLRILNLRIDKKMGEQSVVNGLLKQKFINYILQSHYYSQTFMHDQAMDVLDFEDALLNSVLSDALLFILLFQNFQTKPANNDSTKTRTPYNIPKAIIKAVEDYGDLPNDHFGFILDSCFTGAEYQFSKGVSVFFPWSQMPMKMIFSEYKKLKFTLKYKNWRRFIRKYIELTNRTPETVLLLGKANLQEIIVILSRMTIMSDDDKGQPEIVSLLLKVLLSNEEASRQYIGRQYIGRQYIGRGDAFYDYFSQLRNYSPFELDTSVNPPKEIGLTNCCD